MRTKSLGWESPFGPTPSEELENDDDEVEEAVERVDPELTECPIELGLVVGLEAPSQPWGIAP